MKKTICTLLTVAALASCTPTAPVKPKAEDYQSTSVRLSNNENIYGEDIDQDHHIDCIYDIGGTNRIILFKREGATCAGTELIESELHAGTLAMTPEVQAAADTVLRAQSDISIAMATARYQVNAAKWKEHYKLPDEQ